MKFITNHSTLQHALTRAASVVDTRNTIPILSNALLSLTGNVLSVTGSDMEIAYSAPYEVVGQGDGIITIGAKQLLDIVKSCSKETIEFELLPNDWIGIKSGKANFKIVGLSADGYPEIPTAGGNRWQVAASTLRALIEHTEFSVATDDSRYGLNGGYLEAMEDEPTTLRMVSTDGHRLSIMSMRYGGGYAPVDGEGKTIEGILLSRKGMTELKKLCAEWGDKVVDVAVGSTAVTISHDGAVFFTRLLEGSFPDWRQVVPSSHLRTASISRSSLTSALKRVGLLASKKTNSIRILLSDGKVTLEASDPDVGESRESVEADTEGTDLSIGINANYVLDAMSVMTGDTVLIKFGDSLNPMVFTDPTNENFSAVIMPMRIE